MRVERTALMNSTTRAQPAAAERLAALRALADPVRLSLVDELAASDACACELRERLALSAPLLSHHLRVLREAGLVRTQKAGRRLEVELDRAALGRVAGSLLGERTA
jgi:ArsR family transcriptional regulator, arsenate/arsenite/antimonite-responsive transcriptional repressor